MKKRLFATLLMVVMVLSMAAGCSKKDNGATNEGTKTENNESKAENNDSNTAKDETRTEKLSLKLGHGAQLTHPLETVSQEFAKTVSEKTNGMIDISVFGNTQLGQERDMIEGLQLGTIDIAIVASGPVSSFVPEIGIVDLPYLFTSSEHAYKVLDGEIGQKLLDKLNGTGFVGLGFMENGWRNLTATTKVESPEQLKGLKIRLMENPVHMAAFEAMGASPVAMAWGEVYTSLQSKIINGQENPIPIIYTNNLWEVQDYVMITEHFYTPYMVLMSQKTYDKLSASEKEIIMDAVKVMIDDQRAMMKQQSEEQISLLEENGMEVITVDKKPFIEATKSVYDKFADKFDQSIIEEIRKLSE